MTQTTTTPEATRETPRYRRGDRVTMVNPRHWSDDQTFTVAAVYYDWADDDCLEGLDLSYGGVVVRTMVDPYDIEHA